MARQKTSSRKRVGSPQTQPAEKRQRASPAAELPNPPQNGSHVDPAPIAQRQPQQTSQPAQTQVLRQGSGVSSGRTLPHSLPPSSTSFWATAPGGGGAAPPQPPQQAQPLPQPQGGEQQQQQQAGAPPGEANLPALFDTHNVASVLLARDDLEKAVQLQRALLEFNASLSLLRGLAVRIRKGGRYVCRQIERFGCEDGLLHFKHEVLCCQPGQVSGRRPDTDDGRPTADELADFAALGQEAREAPWTVQQVAQLLWQRRIVERFIAELPLAAGGAEAIAADLQQEQKALWYEPLVHRAAAAPPADQHQHQHQRQQRPADPRLGILRPIPPEQHPPTLHQHPSPQQLQQQEQQLQQDVTPEHSFSSSGASGAGSALQQQQKGQEQQQQRVPMPAAPSLYILQDSEEEEEEDRQLELSGGSQPQAQRPPEPPAQVQQASAAAAQPAAAAALSADAAAQSADGEPHLPAPAAGAAAVAGIPKNPRLAMTVLTPAEAKAAAAHQRAAAGASQAQLPTAGQGVVPAYAGTGAGPAALTAAGTAGGYYSTTGQWVPGSTAMLEAHHYAAAGYPGHPGMYMQPAGPSGVPGAGVMTSMSEAAYAQVQMQMAWMQQQYAAPHYYQAGGWAAAYSGGAAATYPGWDLDWPAGVQARPPQAGHAPAAYYTAGAAAPAAVHAYPYGSTPQQGQGVQIEELPAEGQAAPPAQQEQQQEQIQQQYQQQGQDQEQHGVSDGPAQLDFQQPQQQAPQQALGASAGCQACSQDSLPETEEVGQATSASVTLDAADFATELTLQALEEVCSRPPAGTCAAQAAAPAPGLASGSGSDSGCTWRGLACFEGCLPVPCEGMWWRSSGGDAAACCAALLPRGCSLELRSAAEVDGAALERAALAWTQLSLPQCCLLHASSSCRPDAPGRTHAAAGDDSDASLTFDTMLVVLAAQLRGYLLAAPAPTGGGAGEESRRRQQLLVAPLTVLEKLLEQHSDHRRQRLLSQLRSAASAAAAAVPAAAGLGEGAREKAWQLLVLPLQREEPGAAAGIDNTIPSGSTMSLNSYDTGVLGIGGACPAQAASGPAKQARQDMSDAGQAQQAQQRRDSELPRAPASARQWLKGPCGSSRQEAEQQRGGRPERAGAGGDSKAVHSSRSSDKRQETTRRRHSRSRSRSRRRSRSRSRGREGDWDRQERGGSSSRSRRDRSSSMRGRSRGGRSRSRSRSRSKGRGGSHERGANGSRGDCGAAVVTLRGQQAAAAAGREVSVAAAGKEMSMAAAGREASVAGAGREVSLNEMNFLKHFWDDTWNLERLCVLNLSAKGHTRALADLMRHKTLPKHLVPPAGGELFSAAFERFLSSRPELFKLTRKEGGALHVAAMPGAPGFLMLKHELLHYLSSATNHRARASVMREALKRSTSATNDTSLRGKALVDLPAFCSKHLQESIWVEGEWLELRPVKVLREDSITFPGSCEPYLRTGRCRLHHTCLKSHAPRRGADLHLSPSRQRAQQRAL